MRAVIVALILAAAQGAAAVEVCRLQRSDGTWQSWPDFPASELLLLERLAEVGAEPSRVWPRDAARARIVGGPPTRVRLPVGVRVVDVGDPAESDWARCPLIYADVVAATAAPGPRLIEWLGRGGTLWVRDPGLSSLTWWSGPSVVVTQFGPDSTDAVALVLEVIRGRF